MADTADLCTRFVDLLIANSRDQVAEATAQERYSALAAAGRAVDASIADAIDAIAQAGTVGEGVERTSAVMSACKELGHEPTAEQLATIQEMLVELHDEVTPTT